jgi:two-component system response regulator DevR
VATALPRLSQSWVGITFTNLPEATPGMSRKHLRFGSAETRNGEPRGHSTRVQALVRRRRQQTAISDPLVAEVLNAAATPTQRRRRAPTEPPIRLLLVDQDSVVLLGLRSLFGTARNCEVVAETTSGEDAERLARTAHPDVVVMDADLPGTSSVVASERIHADNPTTQIIMFGSLANPTHIVAAIQAGVRGFLLERTEPARLISAVETLASGGVYFDETVLAAVRAWVQAGQPGTDPLARLTPQERRILRQVAEGKTNRTIAAELGLSEYTVKTYVSAALRKLNLTSRAEAAAFIIRHEPTGSK